MNYLAIDTSSKYLTVIACREGTESVVFASDCALQHSVRLMDAIENAMAQANLGVSDCDFFCAVTGPGSFTGIRIGVSAVKGFCLGTSAPAMGVTSFEVLAYNTEKACLAVIDAARGNYYVCGFDPNKQIDIAPPLCFRSGTFAAHAGKGGRFRGRVAVRIYESGRCGRVVPCGAGARSEKRYG